MDKIQDSQKSDEKNKMCRSCLCIKEGFEYFIHGNVSSDLYKFCTSIEVSAQDDLTKALCNECYIDLMKFTQFKEICLSSNNRLLSTSEILEIPTIINNEDPVNEIELKLEDMTTIYDSLVSDDLAYEDPVIIKPKKRLKEQKLKEELKVENRKRAKKQLYFSCDVCNKKYADADRFEAHSLMHQGKTVHIECKLCNKAFTTWSGLRKHKSSEHTIINLNSLVCATCGKVSKSQASLKMHEKIHDKGEGNKSICDVCGKGFTNKVVLKSHLSTHEPNRLRPFHCQYCDSRFFNKGTLSSHIERRHEGKRYTCHICSYAFTAKFNLKKHMLIHQGIKNYKCTLCDKSFGSQSTLTEHTRIHSGERPYGCICCDKQFISKRRLVEHYRIHVGDKPHKCHLCNQAFTQRGTLKRHLKVHDKNG